MCLRLADIGMRCQQPAHTCLGTDTVACSIFPHGANPSWGRYYCLLWPPVLHSS